MTEPTDPQQGAKIQVDDDWKAQAQAEKERLAAEAADQPAGAGGPNRLPPADFKTLVSEMVTQAMFAMGMIPDPQTGQRYAIVDLAKHHIDMLGVLEEKTKGNLDEEEEKLLTTALHELRMNFVALSQEAMKQATEQGSGDPAADPPAPPAGDQPNPGGIVTP